MIRTILIEDEEKSLLALAGLLSQYCPEVSIIGKAGGAEAAIDLIEELKPDLIFIDVMMPDGTGFDVLERSTYKPAGVIFVTAFEEFALRAFRFSALDYLLKPLNFLDLQAAVKRFEKLHTEKKVPLYGEQMSIAKNTYDSPVPEHIVLPALDGFSIVKLSEIVRCEADSNYTKVVFSTGKPFLASRSLVHFEELLGELHFVRVHHKHLINLAYVRRYQKGRGGMVEMTDGHEVEVSVRKKDEFLAAITAFTRGAV
jgi:two-component system LytT family response regulator